LWPLFVPLCPLTAGLVPRTFTHVFLPCIPLLVYRWTVAVRRFELCSGRSRAAGDRSTPDAPPATPHHYSWCHHSTAPTHIVCAHSPFTLLFHYPLVSLLHPLRTPTTHTLPRTHTSRLWALCLVSYDVILLLFVQPVLDVPGQTDSGAFPLCANRHASVVAGGGVGIGFNATADVYGLCCLPLALFCWPSTSIPCAFGHFNVGYPCGRHYLRACLLPHLIPVLPFLLLTAALYRYSLPDVASLRLLPVPAVPVTTAEPPAAALALFCVYRRQFVAALLGVCSGSVGGLCSFLLLPAFPSVPSLYSPHLPMAVLVW